MPSPLFVVMHRPEDLPETPAKPEGSVGNRRKTTVGISTAHRAARESAHNRYALRRGREITVPKPSEAPDVIPEDTEANMDDLAAVVVRKTQRLLAAGKVVPTLRDGLTAQQLLDRRAEKAADRRFMLNLAMAMAGGGGAAPQKYLPEPEEAVIEGEYEDLDLAPAHLRVE